MNFDARFPVPNGFTGVDPEANPGDIPADHLQTLRGRAPGAGSQCQRILLSVEAATGETITIDIWAADEGTLPKATADTVTPAELAARRFYRVSTGTTVTANLLTEVSTNVPAGGVFYFEVTAETLSADGALLATCAP